VNRCNQTEERAGLKERFQETHIANMGIVEVYHREKQEIEHCMEDNLLQL
jgi:hypothetical protein